MILGKNLLSPPQTSRTFRQAVTDPLTPGKKGCWSRPTRPPPLVRVTLGGPLQCLFLLKGLVSPGRRPRTGRRNIRSAGSAVVSSGACGKRMQGKEQSFLALPPPSYLWCRIRIHQSLTEKQIDQWLVPVVLHSTSDSLTLEELNMHDE